MPKAQVSTSASAATKESRSCCGTFYADVRQHRLIGPIFNERIQKWPEHLAKIGEFWARATGGPSRYSGQMPMKHLTLGLEAGHYGAWLELWDANCRSYLPPREAEEMSALAHGIGQRLQTIVGASGPGKGD